MVFKMSYGATSPAPPAKAAPPEAPPKKPARVRKGGTLQEKAQALFEPSPAKDSDDKA